MLNGHQVPVLERGDDVREEKSDIMPKLHTCIPVVMRLFYQLYYVRA